MRLRDFASLRAARHKLVLDVIGCRRKNPIRHKSPSCRAVRNVPKCDRLETTFRNGRLRFAGVLVWDDENLSRSALCSGDCLHKDVRGLADHRNTGGLLSARERRGSGSFTMLKSNTCKSGGDYLKESRQRIPGDREAAETVRGGMATRGLSPIRPTSYISSKRVLP